MHYTENTPVFKIGDTVAMNKQELLNAGYKDCGYSGFCALNLSDGLFQKRVKEDDGILTRYFIDAWWYAAKGELPEGFQTETRLYLKDGRPLNITAGRGFSVEQAESTFASIYAALDCVPDPHNNDQYH